jgi:gluconate 5-dehydrogenase
VHILPFAPGGRNVPAGQKERMVAPLVSLFDISGRVALVTGSSRGLGRALATALARAGCTVVLNARSAEQLAVTRDEIAADTGAAVHAVPFDVTSPAAVDEAVDRIEATVGPLDILVNNAGVQRRAPLTEFTDRDWDDLVATNLTSAFLLGRAVGRRMAARRSGKIVNICSLQSEVVRPGIAAYSATKGGLKMLTKGMCADLAASGVCVNAIGPGYFETELTAPLVADEQFSEWVRRRTPAGRWGRPEDLAGTLVYLCSPASDFVNGQIVYVDGGMLAVL